MFPDLRYGGRAECCVLVPGKPRPGLPYFQKGDTHQVEVKMVLRGPETNPSPRAPIPGGHDASLTAWWRLVVDRALAPVTTGSGVRLSRATANRSVRSAVHFHHPRQETGFTLIELMITVVVISILAAIALPSYQSYVRQARRVEAQASLIDLQQSLEKWRVNNASYSGCPSDSCSAPASDYYNFSVSSANATSYSLQAVATGTQTADSDCTPLTLNQDSAKGPAGCWKQ
jgi:type IV pilus assembly protein PilE